MRTRATLHVSNEPIISKIFKIYNYAANSGYTEWQHVQLYTVLAKMCYIYTDTYIYIFTHRQTERQLDRQTATPTDA